MEDILNRGCLEEVYQLYAAVFIADIRSAVCRVDFEGYGGRREKVGTERFPCSIFPDDSCRVFRAGHGNVIPAIAMTNGNICNRAVVVGKGTDWRIRG